MVTPSDEIEAGIAAGSKLLELLLPLLLKIVSPQHNLTDMDADVHLRLPAWTWAVAPPEE